VSMWCQGEPGPAGPQGPAGNDGATGPQGPAGATGTTGLTGPAGPQGPAGNDGATGPQGPAGATGATGTTGLTGPAGPQGPAGNTGANGTNGTNGLDGAKGFDIILKSAGTFISTALNATALSTLAGVAGRIDFIPFIPNVTISISALAIEVTTLLAGSNARIGLYSSNANGTPNALIGGSGDLSCAAIGVQSFATSQTLTAGTLYWLAVHTSGTQTLRAVAVGGCQPISFTVSGTAINTVGRATQTYGALPATAPAITSTSANAMWVRMTLA